MLLICILKCAIGGGDFSLFNVNFIQNYTNFIKYETGTLLKLLTAINLVK